jgi:UDP-N-acetylmuramate dehydrogenase
MEEQRDVPLSKFTTLKVGGLARKLYTPNSSDDLLRLIEGLQKRNEPWHVLGGGSNMLISSHGVQGSVIRTTQLLNIENPEPGIIEAGAGVRLPHLARFASNLSLGGLEFSVGIPGTVGGAVVMNAGAHGSCIANILDSATVLDTTSGEIRTWSKEELAFTYRKSAIDPTKHLVVAARFILTPCALEQIKANMQHNEDYRWKTQPINWPSAGSTFKNPEPTRSAGFFLDQAGAKQLKEGGAEVSALHANFVINTGGASSDDVTTLLKRMQETVYNSFSVRLNPEWKTLGEFSQSEKEIWEH